MRMNVLSKMAPMIFIVLYSVAGALAQAGRGVARLGGVVVDPNGKPIPYIPQDENLAYNVGEIYFSNQKVDEALTYFELASKIKPGWSDPYLKMGYVYLNKGDMSRAVEYFEKFLKLEPNTERSAQVQNIINTIKK